MGQERTQPTPISAEEYKLFKEFVRDVHGKERGHLSTELENALREYRESYYGEDRLVRIEEELATIKANVAEVDSDGGTVVADPSPTPSDTESTRPRRTERPAPNQPRNAKIEYLIDELVADSPRTRDSGMLPSDRIRELVQTEYNFGQDTTEEYVDAILHRLDAEENPQKDGLFAWGERFDDMIDALREDAAGELHELDQAEVE